MKCDDAPDAEIIVSSPARRRAHAGCCVLCRWRHGRRADCSGFRQPSVAPALPLQSPPPPLAAPPSLRGGHPAEVLRVIDGDTFVARVHVWPGMDITTRSGCAASTPRSCMRAARKNGSRRSPRAMGLRASWAKARSASRASARINMAGASMPMRRPLQRPTYRRRCSRAVWRDAMTAEDVAGGVGEASLLPLPQAGRGKSHSSTVTSVPTCARR